VHRKDARWTGTAADDRSREHYLQILVFPTRTDSFFKIVEILGIGHEFSACQCSVRAESANYNNGSFRDRIEDSRNDTEILAVVRQPRRIVSLKTEAKFGSKAHHPVVVIGANQDCRPPRRSVNDVEFPLRSKGFLPFDASNSPTHASVTASGRMIESRLRCSLIVSGSFV
jgi:hypothetical protein